MGGLSIPPSPHILWYIKHSRQCFIGISKHREDSWELWRAGSIFLRNSWCLDSRWSTVSSVWYLQVNALSEWIIGIYLHEFTNNEREISIPHEAASCGIENFELIVSERVLVNPDSSRAMGALTFLLFKLNTLKIKIVKLWVSRSHGVMTVMYRIHTTTITPR